MRRNNNEIGPYYRYRLNIKTDDHPRSSACWLPAACFLTLMDAFEVALALKLLTFTRLQFAVRSGGHNPNPGFSSIDESGILLDLSALSDIKLSSDKKVASIGPGATWDIVYEQLEKEELTVVGGRVKGIGVGGLMLGGKSHSHLRSYFTAIYWIGSTLR